jgi:hypothetical protein
MVFQEITLFQTLELIMELLILKMLLLLLKKEWVRNSMLISDKKKIQSIQEIIQFQTLVLIEILNGLMKVSTYLKKC